jgi:hypothetical protein
MAGCARRWCSAASDRFPRSSPRRRFRQPGYVMVARGRASPSKMSSHHPRSDGRGAGHHHGLAHAHECGCGDHHLRHRRGAWGRRRAVGLGAHDRWRDPPRRGSRHSSPPPGGLISSISAPRCGLSQLDSPTGSRIQGPRSPRRTSLCSGRLRSVPRRPAIPHAGARQARRPSQGVQPDDPSRHLLGRRDPLTGEESEPLADGSNHGRRRRQGLGGREACKLTLAFPANQARLP